MEKEQITEILNTLLSTGGDFGELYLEKSFSKSYTYIDNQLDNINVRKREGVGLRLAKNRDVYYGTTDDLKQENLLKVAESLASNLKEEPIFKNITLNDIKEYKQISKVPHDKLSDLEIKEKLAELNKIIRSKDKRIDQVSLNLNTKDSEITIAKHDGNYVKENRMLTRFYITVNFKDGENKSVMTNSYANSSGYELLNTDFKEDIDNLITSGLDKLYAKPCVGASMPVIIGPNFGGVLIHEACGHALEATSVADDASILCGLQGKIVANTKVTLIDDGTLIDEWGSSKIDDEGNPTKKNILIKDGILEKYLVDELNDRKMNQGITGSSRRESYKYSPTSRMNNTYLAPGNDTFEDMIKDIKLGLYAKKMSGGSVAVETGDFNFAVDLAYMIRDGKIKECVKSASLIGNTKDILEKIDMVGSDLELTSGICGSISGSIPVTVGLPTTRVSEILVGGEENA